MSNIAYTPEVLTSMSAAAVKFLKADTDRAFALHEFMRLVGDEPTYDQWMSARAAFIQGYLTTKPAANEDAQNMAWSRYTKQLKAYVDEQGFEMKFPVKPASDKPAAVSQAKARANPYKDLPRAALETEVKKLSEAVAKSPTADNARALLKANEAMEVAVKKAQREADKTVNAGKKKMAKAIHDYVIAHGNDVLALFEALMDATYENSADEVKRRNWELLASVAQKNLTALGKRAPTKSTRRTKKGGPASV